jgi:hypothetical protein
MSRALAAALLAAAIAFAGCGVEPLGTRLERQAKGRSVPGLGRITHAKCFQTGGRWSCDVVAAGQRGRCQAALDGERLLHLYCSRVRP